MERSLISLLRHHCSLLELNHFLEISYHVTQATVKYVTKCVLMQNGWLDWDSMGERHKFLYVRKVKKSVFSEHWKKTMTWVQDCSLSVR